MRDTWKLVPIEPTTAMINAGQCGCMDNDVTVSIYRAILEAAPAPPAPATVQEITRLMNPYVDACCKFETETIPEFRWVAEVEVGEAFKPLQAALTALVDDNHRLKFDLDGVRAMRRPLTDEPFPYQRTFDAIAAATEVSGGHVAISVIKFRKAWAASAPAQADVVTGWQPIETAPKDGTFILLGSSAGAWVARYLPVYQSGYTPENPWQSMMLNHDHMPRHNRSKATHWQPLPPPPPTHGIEPEQGGNHG